MRFAWICLPALMAGLAALAGPGLGAPPRVAIIAEEQPLGAASDVLTAKLSESGQVALLERAQVQKVYREQELSAANRDYLKLGQVLGADGLLILRLTTETEPPLLNVRLVAVKPGISLAERDYPWPLDDLGQWVEAIAAKLGPLFPKLAVPPAEAVAVSILNLRAGLATAEAEALERQLTLLLYNRLMNGRNVFVLERRRLELLAEEKERAEMSEGAFWNGSFLVDGVFDKQGFDKDTVNLEVTLTPPDKSKAVTVAVSGARTNLAEVVNDLGTKILALLGKESGPSSWDARAEAQRYFEEAKWMRHWQMFDQARDAAEAAWALGLQTAELSALRIEAWADWAGRPGICVVHGRRVSFGQLFTPRIIDAAELAAYASAPDPVKFAGIVRAGELFRDAQRRFSVQDKLPDRTWAGLATNVLDGVSWWLRYYYFNVEERVGGEDQIAHARQLCREISDSLEQRGAGGQTNAYPGLLETQARHWAFWAERPEQALEFYRRVLDAGQWPSVRARFFNVADREISVLRYKHGYAWTDSTLASSSNADFASPCLAAWTWSERKRCPEVWKGFIDELCRSAKPFVALEGQILRCSYAWSDADFAANLASLLDVVRRDSRAIGVAGHAGKLLKDLRMLVDLREDTLIEDLKQRVEEKTWPEFGRVLRPMVEERDFALQRFGTPEQQQAHLEEGERYLTTRTNFDFMSFDKLFQHQEYSVEEAKALLPFLATYETHVLPSTNVPERSGDPLEALRRKGERHQTAFWIGTFRQKLMNAITNPVSLTTATATAVHGVPPNAPGPAQRAPGAGSPFNRLAGGGSPLSQGFGRVGSNAGASPENWPSASLSGIPVASNTLRVDHFWSAPLLTNDEPQANSALSPLAPTKVPQLASCCYRDGELWLELRYDAIGGRGQARFAGVNLKTFGSRSIDFRNEDFSLPALMQRRAGSRPFDLDAKYLYVALADSVRRYSFQGWTWEPLTAAGAGKPVRLGRRLFFTSATSILECTGDGSFQVLASSRRRPAVSILDNLDGYEPCLMFQNAQGQPFACIGQAIYGFGPGTSDWKQVATLRANWASAWLFEDGFVAPASASADEWWGMSGHSSVPELLFRLPRRSAGPRPGLAPAANLRPPIWEIPPPSSELCLDNACLWFLVDRSRQSPGTGPRPVATEGRSLEATVVQYRFGEPSPVAIPVRFEAPASSPVSPFTRALGMPYDSQWLLESTPEGLVAARRNAPGFWLISRDELESAIATLKGTGSRKL